MTRNMIQREMFNGCVVCATQSICSLHPTEGTSHSKRERAGNYWAEMVIESGIW